MYGWRARIGLILPASNVTCEQEMARMCPEGVCTLGTRIQFQPTVAGLKRMVDDVERAAEELSCENVSDLIAFCCTVGSLIEGPGHDEHIVKLIQSKCGTPAITTTTGVVQALHHLNVKRVAVATPYTANINEIEKNALQSLGFVVTAIKGIFEEVNPEHFRNDMIGRCGPHDAYQIARQVDSADADGVLISCTNLRAIEIIESLERDLGKPVITSNQSTMWLALRQLGISQAAKGYGQLLETLELHHNDARKESGP